MNLNFRAENKCFEISNFESSFFKKDAIVRYAHVIELGKNRFDWFLPDFPGNIFGIGNQ